MGGIPDEANNSAKRSCAGNDGEDEQPDDPASDLGKAAFQSGALLEFLRALRLRGSECCAAMAATKCDGKNFATARGARFIFLTPIRGRNFDGTPLLDCRDLRATIDGAATIF